MTDPATATDAVRRRLEHERGATAAQVASLTGTFDDIVTAAEDVATDDEHDPEGHTIAYERQQVAALLRSAEAHLADLDDALARLADGAYGRCTECGRPIAPARLEALPAARTCIACAP